MPKRYAAIDIGTNTIKIKIAEHTGKGSFRQVLYKDYPSCLGKNAAENHTIDLRALPECITSLREIKMIAEKEKTDAFACIATHALRVAPNQQQIVDLIKAATGFTVKVIPGEEEARLTLLAVSADIPAGVDFACINVGGGSTELSFHRREGDKFVFFDFGALNLPDVCKDIPFAAPACKQKMEALIKGQFRAKVGFPLPAVDQVLGVGGSIFNAAYIYKKDAERNFNRLNGLKIPASGLASVIALLETATDAAKKNIPGIDPYRLSSVLPGTMVHYLLLNLLQKDEITISTKTISDGIIYELAETSGRLM